ncbi:MAG: hypothetical protein RL758_967 [Pseudomonadota bacterium]|jgi:outer membrane protein assembly factor BamC
MTRFPFGRSLIALTALSLVAGCSTVFEGDKIDYKSAGKAPSLDVPPDLSKLTVEGNYVAPASGSVSATGYQAQASVVVPAATSIVADVRIERLGNQRWLVVSRNPEQLWENVKSFWIDNGFILLQEDRNLGIMETDWAENRAKIPQDVIRNTIGKVLDSLYSTSERDKFRTRMERAPGGGTEIYISHRGMQEISTGPKSNEQIIWTPRATDPELEVEFLRRMMIRLGVTAEQAKSVTAAAVAKPSSQISTVGGQPALQVREGFDKAWRRVGLSLDRSGFTVEDRDRSQGLYFVRYQEHTVTSPQKDDGFFSRWFSANPKPKAPVKYRIQVKSAAESSTVTVLNQAGQPETSPAATQILQLLAADLK